MKCVLAPIYSDGGHCVNGGCAKHGGAPSRDKPPAHYECRRGRERGRSIPFAYPVDKQKDAPLDYGAEFPNPIPNHGTGGYPITLQFVR